MQIIVPSWTEDYLAQLRITALPHTAAQRAGTTLKAVDAWRMESIEFDEACREVMELNTDDLEAVARDHALNGVEKPVTYQGVITDTYQEFDHTLLMRLLEANRDKYSPRLKHTGHDGGPLTVTVREFHATPIASTEPIDAEFTPVPNPLPETLTQAANVDDLC